MSEHNTINLLIWLLVVWKTSKFCHCEDVKVKRFLSCYYGVITLLVECRLVLIKTPGWSCPDETQTLGVEWSFTGTNLHYTSETLSHMQIKHSAEFSLTQLGAPVAILFLPKRPHFKGSPGRCKCMKGLMEESIASAAAAHRLINKTLKQSFHTWLLSALSSLGQSKSIYASSSPLLSLHFSGSTGLHMKEWLIVSSQRLWRSSWHLYRQPRHQTHTTFSYNKTTLIQTNKKSVTLVKKCGNMLLFKHTFHYKQFFLV